MITSRLIEVFAANSSTLNFNPDILWVFFYGPTIDQRPSPCNQQFSNGKAFNTMQNPISSKREVKYLNISGISRWTNF